MEDLLGVPEAAKEYGLNRRQAIQLKFLLRDKTVGIYHDRHLYRRADIEAAITTIEELPRRSVVIVSSCPGCGCDLPARWLLERCHTCLEKAA